MGIKDWFGMGDKAKKKQALRDAVKDAVSDGRLSNSELMDINNLQKELDVTGPADDRTVIRRELYNEAVGAVREKGKLGPQEAADLNKIQKFLALRDDQLEQTKWDLARLRTLTEIRQGTLPTVAATNVALRGVQLEAGEIAHYTVAVDIMDQSSTRGADGLAVRWAGRHEPGSTSGHVLPEDGAKPVGEGALIITSQRLLVKTGTNRQAAVKYSNSEQIFVYSDGIRLQRTVGNTLIKFKSRSEDTGEIVAELLSAVMR
jgi:hypothetical protein